MAQRHHPRPEVFSPQTIRVPWTLTEIREEHGSGGDGSAEIVLVGYASTFEEYEMFGGPPFGWIESIAPDAFDETLSEDPDVVFLVNHEGLPLARSKSGSLELRADDVGLGMEARLLASDPDVQALIPKIERGDVDEMSFAFRVTSQTWGQHDDWPEDDEMPPARTINSVNINRGDVSVVTFGANDSTEIGFRSALDQFAKLLDVDPELALAELRGAVGDDRLPSTIEAIRKMSAGMVDEEAGGKPAPADGMSIGLALSLD